MNNKEKIKTFPKVLQEVQENKQKETMDKVQDAINQLKGECYKVTVTRLVETTGLGRATLPKSYIDEV